MERQTTVLHSGWRYQPDPEDTGERRGYSEAEHDAASWRVVSVPCGLEQGHPDLEWYTGAGWYRCAFSVPESWRGQRVVLRFEGVNYHARVWVNGALVGENGDGFLPFAFPIDAHLRYAQENVLVVRADNVAQPGEVPGQNVGWRPYGGILREVWIEATSRCYLVEPYIVAEPQGEGSGQFTYRATIRNENEGETTIRLAVEIRDAEGRIQSTRNTPLLALKTGEEREVTLESGVEGVTPWSPAAPTLYTARAILTSGAEVLDTLDTRFGFRKVEVREARLWLNGRPIYLLGFNRHEDSPHTGGCTDLATVRRDLEDMKALGSNFVRLCHYPHHPGELDLCDELGLLAMGEIPVYGSTGMAEDEAAYRRKIEVARRQLTTMIRRDRNHPSVIFWSVSNETHEQHAVVVEGNDTLIRHAKSLDPTRLVVHVSDHWSPRLRERGNRRAFAEDDVICLNDYPWMGDRALAEPGRLAEQTRSWVEGMARLHEAFPDKPILVTEFGYESLADVHDNSFSEETHAANLEANFAGMDAPYVCGATIWCYADHAWPVSLREGTRSMTISPFGVLNRRREPKRLAYEAAKKMFAARRCERNT